MKYKFTTNIVKELSDIHTPVELYLKIRDKFPHSFLLESSDYKSRENSYSYLCMEPVASFIVNRFETVIRYPDGKSKNYNTHEINISDELYEFSRQFESDQFDYGFITNGLFGYTSYDAIPLFEDIEFKPSTTNIPYIQYHVFRYIIVFNHFNKILFN